MLKIDVSGTPPTVEFNKVKMKYMFPQDYVGGLITFQFKSINSGTRSEMSYVGVEASAGTLIPMLRHGEAT